VWWRCAHRCAYNRGRSRHLLAARARHEKLKHDHDTHKARRSQLANDHRHADTLLQEARGALARVQAQVALAEQAHTQARQRVLTIEEQQRKLPPETTAEYIEAERTLKDAEAAYQQLIAL
jgi:chromosome segregation ATPase